MVPGLQIFPIPARYLPVQLRIGHLHAPVSLPREKADSASQQGTAADGPVLAELRTYFRRGPRPEGSSAVRADRLRRQLDHGATDRFRDDLHPVSVRRRTPESVRRRPRVGNGPFEPYRPAQLRLSFEIPVRSDRPLRRFGQIRPNIRAGAYSRAYRPAGESPRSLSSRTTRA